MYNDVEKTKNDLDNWQDMWDQALEKGIFPEPEESQEPGFSGGFGTIKDTGTPDGFGTIKGLEEPDSARKDHQNNSEDELLQERKIPNPVYPDSLGPDHENPKPVWTDEKLFKELEDARLKLHDLSVKLAERIGADGKVIEKPHDQMNVFPAKEIEDLQDKIEKLSSSFGIKDEPSPYNSDEK